MAIEASNNLIFKENPSGSKGGSLPSSALPIIAKILKSEYIFEGLFFALVLVITFFEYLLLGYYPRTNTDLYYQSLPFLETFLNHALNFRFPQWNPYLFMGVP